MAARSDAGTHDRGEHAGIESEHVAHVADWQRDLVVELADKPPPGGVDLGTAGARAGTEVRFRARRWPDPASTRRSHVAAVAAPTRDPGPYIVRSV